MKEFTKWKEELPHQQRNGVGMIMKNDSKGERKIEMLVLKPMIGCADWQIQEGMKSEGLYGGSHYRIPFKQLISVLKSSEKSSSYGEKYQRV